MEKEGQKNLEEVQNEESRLALKAMPLDEEELEKVNGGTTGIRVRGRRHVGQSSVTSDSCDKNCAACDVQDCDDRQS